MGNMLITQEPKHMEDNVQLGKVNVGDTLSRVVAEVFYSAQLADIHVYQVDVYTCY